jgi:hypothetical protein
MKEPRNYRDAHHVIAWGGCMNPYRLHAQNYTPAPRPQPNRFQRLMRWLLGVK